MTSKRTAYAVAVSLLLGLYSTENWAGTSDAGTQVPESAADLSPDPIVSEIVAEAGSIAAKDIALTRAGVYAQPYSLETSWPYFKNADYIELLKRWDALEARLTNFITPRYDATDKRLNAARFRALYAQSDRILKLQESMIEKWPEGRQPLILEKVVNSFVRELWNPLLKARNWASDIEGDRFFRAHEGSTEALEAIAGVPHQWTDAQLRELSLRLIDPKSNPSDLMPSSAVGNFALLVLWNQVRVLKIPLTPPELAKIVARDKARGGGADALMLPILYEQGAVPVSAGELLTQFGYEDAILNGDNSMVERYLSILKQGVLDKPELILSSKFRSKIRKVIDRFATSPRHSWEGFLAEMAGDIPAKALLPILVDRQAHERKENDTPAAKGFRSTLAGPTKEKTTALWRLLYLRHLKKNREGLKTRSLRH